MAIQSVHQIWVGYNQIFSRKDSKILEYGCDNEDYVIVRINEAPYKVHRLICVAFKNFDINSNLTINHIDGNKKNNKLDNLEILSIHENIIHAFKTGLMPKEKPGNYKNCQT